MEMQSVWKDCSKFDGLLVMIPPCGVQLPQLTCNPCNSNAIRWPLWLDCMESATPPSCYFVSTVPRSSLGGFQSDFDLGQSWADLWQEVAILKQSV